MKDQLDLSDQGRFYDSSIPAHSPFMPGNSGKCMFAICDEADRAELIKAVSDYLNSAASIMYLVMKEEAEADRRALRGVLRLIEIAEGMARSQGAE